MTKKAKVSETYCLSCECLLLTEQERFDPICGDCFKKTKRKDPLMQAAIREIVVAVVPMLCPHNHACRTRFNVLVLGKNLESKQITGPFSARNAELEAQRIRRKLGRRR